MTSNFDQQIQEAVKKGNPALHGFLIKCVDKTGKTIYSKKAGYSSLNADASEIREDAVFKIASATKLLASIALLQCIERGQITLDDPITTIIPELKNQNIISADESSDKGYTLRPSTKPITSRHLLTHTTGLGYYFMVPLLDKWRETESANVGSNKVVERYDTPLLFEPGEGWNYSTSLDWAGLLVSRLNNNINLEDYFVQHIFKPVGVQAPFPTFHISRHPEYKARVLQPTVRGPDGTLKYEEYPFGDNPEDEEGGGGLACTMDAYVAVLGDLIKDTPTILKRETVESMFEPQLSSKYGIDVDKAIPMLRASRPAWELVAGPIENENLNYGLGGLIVQDEVRGISQPANILAWGGATNIVWFISRDHGVAGFFGTQILPFGEPKVQDIVFAWKKDFWETVLGGTKNV